VEVVQVKLEVSSGRHPSEIKEPPKNIFLCILSITFTISI
jgi:hypothetical protein